jgi:hypothetical protein
VLGHSVGDVAEVAADVGQRGAVAQQSGGQGVSGLVSDDGAKVELGDPLAEPGLEPVVGHRPSRLR